MPAIPNPMDLLGRNLEGLVEAITSATQPARDIASLAPRVLERLDRLEQRADRVIELGEMLASQADRMLTLAEKLDARGEAVLHSGDKLVAEAARVVEQAAHVNAQAAQLIAVIPTVEQAIGLVRPLEGAVERLGRMADRLPGGSARK
jgi:hypothetical protein